MTVRSMIVDSTPTSQAPPSTMPSIFPHISSRTCSAVVQLGRPEMLALGAATGTPAFSMMARVTAWSGHLMPTVSSPPVVRSGTQGFFFRIIVSGPGQKRSASR